VKRIFRFYRKQSTIKCEAIRLAIKTNGLMEHVSLTGTSPLGYHRGVPTRLVDTLARITPDVLMIL